MSKHEGTDFDALERTFKHDVAGGWVWMDYISIPQTVGLSNADEVQPTPATQAILPVLKAGESGIRHFLTLYRVSKTLLDAIKAI